MNKQLGKNTSGVGRCYGNDLTQQFQMQNEGDRSLKIVLNKNKSVEYTVDVGKWSA